MATLQERVERQVELENLFNKNQLMPRIRQEIEDSGIRAEFEAKGIDPDFGIKLLIQMQLHKRCDLMTLAGALRKHFAKPGVTNPGQATVDEITKCVEHDFVNYDFSCEQFVVVYELSSDVQAEIDMFQYPLPMTVEPKKLESNRDTGYLTYQGSVILKAGNHHDGDTWLAHLDRLNGIKFAFNKEAIATVQNRWRNLDKPKAGETAEDFQKRRKAFEKYDATARDAIRAIDEVTDHFYLTHKYDKRQRTYCQGYHISYQGAPWNKASIEFFDREHID